MVHHLLLLLMALMYKKNRNLEGVERETPIQPKQSTPDYFKRFQSMDTKHQQAVMKETRSHHANESKERRKFFDKMYQAFDKLTSLCQKTNALLVEKSCSDPVGKKEGKGGHHFPKKPKRCCLLQ